MSRTDKNRIDSIIKQASRILGVNQHTVDSSYQRILEAKLNYILRDDNHPLYTELDNAIIPRSGRMRLPYAATNRHKSSFIPQCIKLFNKRHVR